MTKVDNIIENNIVTLDGGLGSELEKSMLKLITTYGQPQH